MVPPREHWANLIFGGLLGQPRGEEQLHLALADVGPGPGLALTAELFSAPRALDRYDDTGLALGLKWLTTADGAGWLGRIYAVPPDLARQVVGAIPHLFEQVLAPRCRRSGLGAGPLTELEAVCYMWWDAADLLPDPERPRHAAVDAEVLRAQAAILGLDSVPCQLSALHGLNHWSMYYPAQAAGIVDEWLAQTTCDADVREYALGARLGLEQ